MIKILSPVGSVLLAGTFWVLEGIDCVWRVGITAAAALIVVLIYYALVCNDLKNARKANKELDDKLASLSNRHNQMTKSEYAFRSAFFDTIRILEFAKATSQVAKISTLHSLLYDKAIQLNKEYGQYDN